MGSCISSSDPGHSRRQKPTADVVSLNGELRRYPLPVTASQVLRFEALTPESSSVCNSDRMYSDDYVPRLEPEDELDSAQIYFVLPVSKLRHRLAALAVKASVVINESNPHRSRRTRISPVLDSQSTHRSSTSGTGPVQCRKSSKPELGVSRSGSVKKVHRNGSRRVKPAARSRSAPNRVHPPARDAARSTNIRENSA